MLTGFNSDEGSIFVPTDKKTDAEYRDFWAESLPRANASVLNRIAELYPDPDANQTFPYLRDAAKGSQFGRLSAAYGDYAYISAVAETAKSLAKAGSKVWKYHFDYTPKRKSFLVSGWKVCYATLTRDEHNFKRDRLA